MNLFRFEKWFFDIVTPDNDYIIFYHTLSKFLIFRVIYLEIHVARNDWSGMIEKSYSRNIKLHFTRRAGHNLITKSGRISFHDAGCSYEIIHDKLSIRLEIEDYFRPDQNWPVMIIGKGRKQKIEWQPLSLKGIAKGKISAGQDIEITGFPGYIDYVSSNFNPFKVPVKELFWGRLHDDSLDITYSYAIDEARKSDWNLFIIRVDSEIIEFRNLTMDIVSTKYSEELEMHVPESYRLTGKGTDSRFEIKVEHIKAAVISKFIDSIQSRGKNRKKIFKKLTGDPKGIKFHSVADIKLEYHDKNKLLSGASLISEYVRFK